MKIKKATKKDVPRMLKLIVLNNPRYNKKRASKELKEMFSKILHKPKYLLAEENSDIVAFGGYISSWVDDNVYNLFWINVHPKSQNKGIGTKLVKNLIKEIKKEKDPRAKLITISTKKPAFYRKMGFKKISPKYDGDYLLMGIKI